MPKSSSAVFFICGSQGGGMFQWNIFFIDCNTLFTISRKTGTLSCYHFPEIQILCLVASNDQKKSELFTHSVTLFIIQNMCNFYHRTLPWTQFFQDFFPLYLNITFHSLLMYYQCEKITSLTYSTFP